METNDITALGEVAGLVKVILEIIFTVVTGLVALKKSKTWASSKKAMCSLSYNA